jgi:DNA-directed RNA polymerase specialized sigma24 family protein
MAALHTVPLPRRAVIIMHDLDGVSIVDVAASLSLTRFGAHARLRKGRTELCACEPRPARSVALIEGRQGGPLGH